MKHIFIALLLFGDAALSAPYYFNPTLLGGGLGWGGEGFYLDIPPTQTQQGCQVTDQIVIASTHPAYKESVAVALTIIGANLGSRITVDGCFNGRPKVVGMGLSAQ